MARTTRSTITQGTVGPVPDPIEELDPANKQSIPKLGGTVRWLIESPNTSTSRYFDPLGQAQDDSTEQHPGAACIITQVIAYTKSVGGAGAAMHFELRKNGNVVIVGQVPRGTGHIFQGGIEFNGRTDTGIWEINSADSSTASAALIIVQFRILNDGQDDQE